MITIETVVRPPKFPVVLAIDPSITVMGWALFDGAHATHIYDLRAWTYGRIRPKGLTIQAKWEDAATRLDEATGNLSPDHLVCEWPAHFVNLKGTLAAKLGSNFPLCGLTGYLMGRFDFSGAQVTLYEPAKWKGSAPKRVTLSKFKHLFSRDASPATNNEIERISAALSDHEIDAIMLAVFWLWQRYIPKVKCSRKEIVIPAKHVPEEFFRDKPPDQIFYPFGGETGPAGCTVPPEKGRDGYTNEAGARRAHRVALRNWSPRFLSKTDVTLSIFTPRGAANSCPTFAPRNQEKPSEGEKMPSP
ncbi:MAG: hypothetical protein C5B58_11720 [Acidobacteria bacterium]|nr:MAG: hypothetical protein C5B58_11720 [Acidobacteriota bacterium]